MFVTFKLTIQGSNVVDLFKDFTAMCFVSSFNDIIYTLAGMNLFGKIMKDVVNECDQVTYDENDESPQLSDQKEGHGKIYAVKNFIFRPLVINILLLVMMYAIWAYLILIPHLNGDYLCQSIYIQLDDNVNPQLSYFSGSYTRLKGKETKGYYNHVYRETKRSLSYPKRKPMVLQYCDNIGSWVFALEAGSVDVCNERSIKAKSAHVSNQEKYDLFEVDLDGWLVKHQDGRLMPLEDFHISCQDESPKYLFESSSECEDIEVNELTGKFQSVGSEYMSTSYTMLKHVDNNLPVLVYDHPVFTSLNEEDYDFEKDIIFYAGKRWILTTTSDFFDFIKANKARKKKNMIDLQEYLEYHFHGSWSNYNVAFFSESTVVDTPQDRMMPTELKWFAATPPVKGEKQEVDEKEKVEGNFICTSCHNETNPCYYDGICLEDKTCDCISGSSGTLCQVEPTSNGLCNPFFNTPQFGFDGGDCCVSTCSAGNSVFVESKSTSSHKCGYDERGLFYMGYDICHLNTGVKSWSRDKYTTLDELSASHVSVSPNGQVIALIESTSKTVRVYDSNGYNWFMRGSAVTEILHLATDIVQVSSRDFMVHDQENLFPVTVAIKRNASILVYDWSGNSWEEMGIDYFKSVSVQAIKMELREYGNSLGILYEDRSFKYFRRASSSRSWEELKNNTSKSYDMFSVSNSGEKFILGNRSCIELHDHQNMIDQKCYDSEIRNIKISPRGTFVGVLLINRSYYVMTYDISENKFDEINSVLYGITANDATIEISDDGKEIIAHSENDKNLQFYTQTKNSIWVLEKDTINLSGPSISAISLATKNKVLAFVHPHSVSIYRQYDRCQKGTSRLRLSFVSDMEPHELFWEIVSFNILTKSKNSTNGGIEFYSSNEIISLKKGGPYQFPEYMITESICVSESILDKSDKSNDSCIGVKITDLGLNGLQKPGRLAIIAKGQVIWSTNSTNGYESLFPVVGHPLCLQMLSDHYPQSNGLEVILHTDCYTEKCEWYNRWNYESNISISGDLIRRFISLSSDGSILAFGDFKKNEGAGEVRIFKYKEGNGWTPYGPDLRDDRQESLFGYSVSLSANGSIIAIGSPGANGNGEIQVYKYEKNERRWSQRGNIINDPVSMGGLGSSIGLSADGTVLVVGYFSSDSSNCPANVYRFDHVKDHWNFESGCSDSMKEEGKSIVEVSSSGSFYALGLPYSDENGFDSGSVSVYEYNDFKKSWIQRGQTLEGDYWHGNWGRSISFSADGSVLAVAGKSSRPVRVFKYTKKHEIWEQIGQDIHSQESSDPNNDQIDLSLSYCGSVLVVSSFREIRFFSFNEVENLWVKSLTKVPAQENPGPPPRVAVSADAVTLALVNTTSVSIYHLQKMSHGRSNNSCEEDHRMFNFTIYPDKFPEDISWRLQNSKEELLMEGMGFRDCQKNPKNWFYFTLCIPSDENFFLFAIEDKHGDGICCEWGVGSFSVQYNNRKITDENGFRSRKLSCFAESERFSALSIALQYRTNETEDSLAWFLLDSDFGEINGGDVAFLQTKEDFFFNTCLPSDKCFILRIVDALGHGTPFKLTYENELVHEHTSEAFLSKKVMVGDCNETQLCPQDQGALFELDLFANKNNVDLSGLSWNLLDLSDYNKTLMIMDNYTSETKEKRFYYADCFPTMSSANSNCLSFQISNKFGDEMEISYSVWWQDELIHNGHTLQGHDEVKFGDCNP